MKKEVGKLSTLSGRGLEQPGKIDVVHVKRIHEFKAKLNFNA